MDLIRRDDHSRVIFFFRLRVKFFSDNTFLSRAYVRCHARVDDGDDDNMVAPTHRMVVEPMRAAGIALSVVAPMKKERKATRGNDVVQ